MLSAGFSFLLLSDILIFFFAYFLYMPMYLTELQPKPHTSSYELAMPKKTTDSEKEKQARLGEEIENLTRKTDELLGEVVTRRKNYPYVIAELKALENQEKLARLVNAPLLSVSTSDRIDVEKLKNEITMKVDKTKIESDERKELERETEEKEAELSKWEQQRNLLLDGLAIEMYAPIDALPPHFSL
ncbi:hypothetical protein Aduo_014282 [Ancylostoma duodenale]